MMVITESNRRVAPGALVGKERDALVLTWEERRWGRRRALTRNGREVALALPTGSVLTPGSVLVAEQEWYLVVEPACEPVLAAFPRDQAEAIRVAFEVGNRHFPLAQSEGALVVPDDTAMEQLLSRLGVRWERWVTVFEPIGGGGHRHA